MRDPRLDESAHPVPDGQPIEQDDAAPLAESECPRCAAGTEPERQCRPGHGPKLARLPFRGRSRSGGEHRAPRAVVRCSMSWLGRACREHDRESSHDCGYARRNAPPGTGQAHYHERKVTTAPQASRACRTRPEWQERVYRSWSPEYSSSRAGRRHRAPVPCVTARSNFWRDL